MKFHNRTDIISQYNPSKPNYNEPEYEDEDEDSEADDKPEIGAVVVESGNSGQMNGGLNWNNGGGMNWVRIGWVING